MALFVRRIVLPTDVAARSAVIARLAKVAAAGQAGGLDGVELDFGEWDRCAGFGAIREEKTALGGGVMAVRGRLRTVSTREAADLLRDFLGALSDSAARALSVALPPLDGALPPSVPTWGYRETLTFTEKLLQETRRDAERAGIPLLLEACAGGCLLSPVELSEMLDHAGSWAVGAAIDLCLVERISRPEDWIVALGRRLRMVRLETSGGKLNREGIKFDLYRRIGAPAARLLADDDERIVSVADWADDEGIDSARREPIG